METSPLICPATTTDIKGLIISLWFADNLSVNMILELYEFYLQRQNNSKIDKLWGKRFNNEKKSSLTFEKS